MQSQRVRDRLFKRIVGLMFLATIAASIYVINIYNQQITPFDATMKLRVIVDRADAIRTGTSVTLAGIPVGKVLSLDIIEENKIEIVLEINARYADRLRFDSKATLIKPIIGNAVIDISMGGPQQVLLQDGGAIVFERTAQLDDLIVQLPKRIKKIDDILDNMVSVSSGLATDDGDFQQSLEALNETMREVQKLSASLTAPSGNFQSTLGNLENISTESEKMVVGLNATISRIDGLVVSFSSVVDRLDRVLSEAQGGTTQMTGVAEKVNLVLDDALEITSELKKVSPQLRPVMETGRTVMQEAEEVMKAAKKNFLLSPNIPKVKEPLLIESPRPIPVDGESVR